MRGKIYNISMFEKKQLLITIQCCDVVNYKHLKQLKGHYFKYHNHLFRIVRVHGDFYERHIFIYGELVPINLPNDLSTWIKTLGEEIDLTDYFIQEGNLYGKS